MTDETASVQGEACPRCAIRLPLVGRCYADADHCPAREPEPPVPAPSDEAVATALTTLASRPRKDIRRALTAAYDIDMRAVLAELERLHAENGKLRAAGLQLDAVIRRLSDENEHLRATLSHLLMFARGNEHVLGVIHAALDRRYEVDEERAT